VLAAVLALVLGGSLATSSASAATTCFGKAPTKKGTSANDTIEGTAGNDVIIGKGGNDVIDGMGGKDRICGGGGDDEITGGAGADRIAGEDGDDAIHAVDGEVDTVKGNAGANTCAADPADIVSKCVPPPPAADLVASDILTGPAATGPFAGDYVYGFQFDNDGPDRAQDIVLTVTVPANFAVEDASGCTQNGTTFTCPWGSADSGVQDFGMNLRGHFTSAAQGTFTTAVSSSTADPDPSDNSASRTVTPGACANGVDDDSDGQTDLADSGCSSGADTSELPEQCRDGIDNDSDGKTDHPADPGCDSANDDSESPDPMADLRAASQMFDRLSTTGEYRYGGDVVNYGPAPVPTAEVTITTPANFTVTSTSLPCVASGHTFTCSINGPFAPGSNGGPGGSARVIVKGYFTTTAGGTFRTAVAAATGGPADPDNSNNSASTELATSVPPACVNGADDDGDTLTDFPADPQCAASADDHEDQ
jgi:hypothetical protein